MKSQPEFHYLQPDYSKTPFQLPVQARENIYKKLQFLYADEADFCIKEIGNGFIF